MQVLILARLRLLYPFEDHWTAHSHYLCPFVYNVSFCLLVDKFDSTQLQCKSWAYNFRKKNSFK